MTKLSYRAFFAIFNVCFYFFLLGALIITGQEVARWIRNDMTATHSFSSFQSDQLNNPIPQKVELTAADERVNGPYLVADRWDLKFVARDWRLRAYRSALVFIRLGYVLLVLFIFRAFVISIQKNETFTLQNIKRLQRIGFLLLFIEPFRWIVKYFTNQWVIDYFNLDAISRSASYSIGHSLGYGFGYAVASGGLVWNWVLAGLMVLVIAEVFKQGLKLKDEVDLTV